MIICAVSILSLNELTVRKIASVEIGINIETTDFVPFVIAWMDFHKSFHWGRLVCTDPISTYVTAAPLTLVRSRPVKEMPLAFKGQKL